MEEIRTKRPGGRTFSFILGLVYLAGICIMAYPAVSDWRNRMHAGQAVQKYETQVKELSEAEIQEILGEARAYNKALKENPDPWSEKSRTPGYTEALRTERSGIMGCVMIEKIRVRLPFYHGTEEDVLQRAVGHVEGSSLPTGDKGGHAVLSAHRGLPSAKLFTDLPELASGDTFVITVLNKEMIYEVDQILTVLPDSPEVLEALGPVPGEDLVTLMTCTPYGINTHRLLVRGHRTGDVVHSEKEGGSGGNEENGISFDRYIPFAAAAALVIFLLLWFLPVGKKNAHK